MAQLAQLAVEQVTTEVYLDWDLGSQGETRLMGLGSSWFCSLQQQHIECIQA